MDLTSRALRNLCDDGHRVFVSVPSTAEKFDMQERQEKGSWTSGIH